MKISRFGELAAQSAIGIAVFFAFVIVMLLMCVMGVLLIPYNVARVVAWFFGMWLKIVAGVIASIEDLI